MKQTTLFAYLFFVAILATTALAQETPTTKSQTFNDKEVYHQKLIRNTFKPYVDVLCTPDGRNILRDSPSDHVHHHGLMFAVGVDKIDFWGEFDDTCGKQIVTGISTETLLDSNNDRKKDIITNTVALDWTAPDGTVMLKEARSIIANRASNSDVTLLTWCSRLKTPPSGKTVTLDGHHYYGLGMRFDQTMDANGRFFANEKIEPGEIVRGDERLTSCHWMAYTARLHEKPVTVAMFDMPTNPRPMLAFTMGDHGGPFAYFSATVNLFREPLELTEEKPLDFVYGIAIWEGEHTPDTIEAVYQQWQRGANRGDKK